MKKKKHFNLGQKIIFILAVLFQPVLFLFFRFPPCEEELNILMTSLTEKSSLTGGGAKSIFSLARREPGGHFLFAKKQLARYSAGILVVLLFVCSFVYLVNTEILYSPEITYGEYQPGFKEAVPILNSLEKDYQKVIIESPHAQSHIFVLYYQSYPPELIQKEHNFSTYANFQPTINFGKYEFRRTFWPEDRKFKNTLFWGSVYSLPEKDIYQDENVKI